MAHACRAGGGGGCTIAESAAIERFVREQDAYLGYVIAITRDRDAAEEVLQNAVVAILAQDATDIRDFARWAKEVVRRQALLWLRTRIGERQRVARMELVESVLQAVDEDEPDAAADARLRAALQACLAQAPARAREMLVARVQERASFDAIARSAGTTSAAVQRAISRVRIRLRQCIDEVLRRRPVAGGV